MIHIESSPSSFNHLNLYIRMFLFLFHLVLVLLHMGDLLASGAWS